MTSSSVPPGDLPRTARRLTLAFCTAIVLVGVVLVVVVGADGYESARGLALGLLLGVVGFVLARWVPARGLHPLPAGEHDDAASGRVLTAAFLGTALSEAPALVAVAIAFATDGDRGVFLVAGPLAIASIILNGTGTPALRRHVARLEADGGTTGITP